MRWAAGETIVLQEVYKARLWAVRPMIVVQDEPGEIVLWHPKGSIRQVPTNPPTRERLETRAERFAASLTLLDWIHIDNEWDVDTQEPFRRTPRGVRTMDLELDVIIWPDRSWYYKDEDEFEYLLANRLIEETKGKHAREEALRVIAAAQADEPPFNDQRWTEWKPDPDWRLPVLPDDWDRL